MKNTFISILNIPILYFIMGFNAFAFGQTEGTAINGNLGFKQIGNTPMNASAIIEMKSTNKGMLLPRLTTAQINSVSSPTQGLMLYDTDTKCVKTYNGSVWECLNSASAPASTPPSTSYAFRTTGDSYNYGESIAVDASNNVYLTGHFTGALTFGKGANVATITSAGYQDAFIVKLDANGELIWATNISGTDDQESYDIALDNSGNVYVTGYLQGNTSFNSASGATQLFSTSYYYEQIFVAKYSSSGNLTWYKTASATASYNSRGQALALDASGNAYVTGYYAGNALFGSTTLNSISNSSDIFITKLNASDGNFLWSKSAGSNSDTENAADIAVDNSGNAYITGWYSSVVTFGISPTTTTFTSRGNRDTFIAKYNLSGDFQWAKTAGSVSEDYGQGIAFDNVNNVLYVTGYYYGNTFTFGTGIGTNPLIPLGYNDIYLARYDSNGNLNWAIQVGGSDNDYGKKIATDATGNPYLYGTFRGTSNFKSFNSPNTFYLVASNYNDPFIAKYSPSGILQWAIAAVGGYDEEAYGLVVKNNTVFTIGNFKLTQNFAYQQLTSSQSGYNGDIFIWRYAE
jgi:hypothetical protein